LMLMFDVDVDAAVDAWVNVTITGQKLKAK
jgi:hypothetical protein